jgi:uncharacterized integral membrane protein (TIGR00698 family)
MAARVLPGLLLAIGVALAARVVAAQTQLVPDVVLALVAGLAVNAVVRLPAAVRPGTRFVLHYLLRAAIVLLGAGLTVAEISRLGSLTILLVIACVVTAMSLGMALGRCTRLPPKIGVLIGAGTAICGGSAILAIAPLIEAEESETAYAVAVIFTFNIVALLAYPILGHALGMDQVAFGTWAGTAVNDTSVVVATGYAYGHAAGATATIVKLTRTLLLVPLALGVSTAYGVRSAPTRRSAVRVFPWFVLGFAGAALLNSTGAIPAVAEPALAQLAAFLIVVVMAAVGLNVDFGHIRRMGIKPLLVGFGLAASMALVSLSLLHALRVS